MADKISYSPRGRYFEFSGDLKEAVFGKTLMPMAAADAWFSEEVQKDHDKFNEYNANNYLHRGPDFTSGVDILAVGCSMTYGLGVPESGTWPALLAKDLGMTYANLSMTGAGMEWISDSIYRYIETFGPPNKAIVVLAPDVFRYDILFNRSDILPLSEGPKDFIPKYLSKDGNLGKITMLEMADRFPKVMKRPYPAEYTRIPEEHLSRSVRELRNLERYCKTAGINLIWGSWSDQTIELMKALDEESMFDNYVELGEHIGVWTSHWHGFDLDNIVDHRIEHGTMDNGCTEEMFNAKKCICIVDCHADREHEWTNSFHVGADIFKDRNSYHHGIHTYIHIAEGIAEHGRQKGIF